MKSFFVAERSVDASIDIYSDAHSVGSRGSAQTEDADRAVVVVNPHASFSARVAVYDAPLAAPRVEDIHADSPRLLIDDLSKAVYEFTAQAGGSAPYTVIREVVENLIHAEFREIVVSILDHGNTLRFADQGPGIPDKERALRPGFSTATLAMKEFVRGVGSGLPIVSEFLSHNGGSLEIEDNLGRGTVVTLVIKGRPDSIVAQTPVPSAANDMYVDDVPPLSLRQKKVLSLVLELGEVGPTLVSKELAVGLSTAYRDLASLEEFGLIDGDESGKRVLTPKGSAYLGRLFD